MPPQYLFGGGGSVRSLLLMILCSVNQQASGLRFLFRPYPIQIQWKPLIMITLGLALFDKNNRLITLSGGYKNLHYLTQFIVTVQPFNCTKNNKIYLKKTYVVLSVVCLQLVVPD
jgi:hypothetical protein